jgi:hypothetical protein
MVRERFVSESDSKQSIENVFIIFGYIVLTVIIMSLLYWSYNKNIFIFIIMICLITFIYSIIMMSLALINKDMLDNAIFNTQFGGSIFVMFFQIFLIVFFLLKYFQVI